MIVVNINLIMLSCYYVTDVIILLLRNTRNHGGTPWFFQWHKSMENFKKGVKMERRTVEKEDFLGAAKSGT